jgi:hypothetical protein
MFTVKLPKKIASTLSWKQWMFFWYRHYKGMFFVGFLVVLCLGGYFWYQNLYQYRWSPERKKTFLEQHFKETRLKAAAFDDTVVHLEERALEHQRDTSLSQDIFTGTSL